MMLTYPHIAIYLEIHYEETRKIDDNYMNWTDNVLDGGWMRYPPVPPLGIPGLG